MTDPFGASQGMSTFGSPGMSTNQPGADIGAQLGIPPQILAALRQRMAGMPPAQHAAFLRQALSTIPGIKEKLTQLTSPLNQNVDPVAPPPPTNSMMTTPFDPSIGQPPPGAPGYVEPTFPPAAPTRSNAPMAAPAPPSFTPMPGPVTSMPNPMDPGGPPVNVSGPPPMPGAPPVASGPATGPKQANPNRHKGRLAHGKGLPPGQQGKMTAAAYNAGMTDTPGHIPGGSNPGRPGGGGRFRNRPQSVPTTGLQVPPQPMAPRPMMNPYRENRMSGGSRPVY